MITTTDRGDERSASPDRFRRCGVRFVDDPFFILVIIIKVASFVIIMSGLLQLNQ